MGEQGRIQAGGGESDREALLRTINQFVPENVDWKEGAKTYVASCFDSLGRENVERYSFSKPLMEVGPDDPRPAIEDITHYMNAFSNAISLIKPSHGARVLDVACGGGWVSHYLSKMGYWTYGIDISADFIELARRRLASDPLLEIAPDEAETRFAVLDIERERLPENLRGSFDIIWLESCLHHFYDPISALENLAEALRPDGILVLIEFENRKGPIKPEYMRVMEEFDTLERPYNRLELIPALKLAGFPEVEFLGSANGWFRPDDPQTARMGEIIIAGSEEMNLAICAKTPQRLDAIFPGREKAKGDVRLGSGFYPPHNGYCWSEPVSEIIVNQPLSSYEIEVHSSANLGDYDRQTVVAYGKNGEFGRCELSAGKMVDVITCTGLQPGDRIRLISTEAFSPSWTGGGDDRILSFYVRADSTGE